MEDYRCIHVTKILRNDCKIDSLIMRDFTNVYKPYILCKLIVSEKLFLLFLTGYLFIVFVIVFQTVITHHQVRIEQLHSYWTICNYCSYGQIYIGRRTLSTTYRTKIVVQSCPNNIVILSCPKNAVIHYCPNNVVPYYPTIWLSNDEEQHCVNKCCTTLFINVVNNLRQSFSMTCIKC